MSGGDLGARLAGRAEQLDELCREQIAENWLTVVPSHVDAFTVMDEVVQVQLKRAVALQTHNPVHLLHECGRAVRRKTHDFAFVAVAWKSEPLGDSCVEDAEGVREMDRTFDIQACLPTDAPH